MSPRRGSRGGASFWFGRTVEDPSKPLEDYTQWLSAAGRPGTTVYLRTYHVRRFLSQCGVPPFQVTLEHLTEHLASPGWAPNTRHSIRSSLRSFYHWAYLTGRMSADPSALLPRVTVQRGKPRPASDGAVNGGLVAPDARVRLMVRLAAHAGLRCGEICRVHTADVTDDLLGHSLRVLGKGGKVRVVPITVELAAELRAHPPGFVFPGQIDGHLSAGYVSKLISRALPPGITPHQLRHRFASRAFRGSGYNLRAVQELLGHASVATTQIYTAVDDDDLRRAAMSAA